MRGIPFQLPDVGLREINGKVYLDDEFVVFDVQDALAGEWDKELQVIKVEPSALGDVHLEKGVVRDRLIIRPKKTELLEAMPGTYGTELPLKIWRNHRERVEQLIEEIKSRVV